MARLEQVRQWVQDLLTPAGTRAHGDALRQQAHGFVCVLQ